MSIKHLRTGDALPPLQKDTLRIYSMRFCPFAQRTRLVLEHKGIQYETVNIDLKNKPTWMFDKNPLGLVPFLEYNDKVVYESTITCEYLDEVYTQKPLLPEDPYLKARLRMLNEHYGKIIGLFYKMRNDDPEVAKPAVSELQDRLQILEKELQNKNFFGGDAVNMLDYYIWPWWERIANLEDVIPQSKFPNFNKWITRMFQDSAVKATAETLPTHQAIMNAYLKGGNIDYDIEPIPA